MTENSLRENLSVIVIDDDYDVVESFTEFLELNKVNVIGKGYDGRDAMNLYWELRPDVVFLDVMMPEYDGFYALQHIRQANHDALVVMITADHSKETNIKLKNMEATSIVYKPFETKQIIEIVDKLSVRTSINPLNQVRMIE